MNKYVYIYFEFERRVYGVLLKTSVDDITLSMVKDKIYKKLELDESKVKLELSYVPMVVGCEERFTLGDDEDLYVYLMHVDKRNCRCLLFLETTSKSEQPDQLSRVSGLKSIRYELPRVAAK